MGRLPERDTRAAASRSGRFSWRPSNAMIAVIFLLVFTIGPYLAFTGHVPFTSYGYELQATFSNGVNISVNSPVRMAGVNVGQVVGVERDGDNTTVTFTVEGKGRPVHDDAFAAIRPRIFLEGNFFVDLSPGSPSAPELGSGDTIPISHTSTWVQIDEVLTALQSPVRADLSRFLEAYGEAFTHKPSAAEDATQLPEVRGKSAAQALNKAFHYGGDAGRYGAQVTNALLGTRQHDLSRLVATAGSAFGALGRHEEDLKGLIVNFDTFSTALAAQSANLAVAVHRLAPTLKATHSSLVSLNRTLPPLRAFAIELTPAVAEIPGWIKAGRPWLAQARPLLSGKELGGTAKLLREATPGLAGSAQAGKALTIPQLNRLGLCGSRVIVPTGNEVIEDQFSTGGPNYREFLYTLADFAGWGSNFDGNGPYVRVQPGGGNLLVEAKAPEGNLTTDKQIFGHTSAPPLGTQPQLAKEPPKKPGVRCDSNPVPDVNAGLGQPGAPSPAAISP